MFSRLLFSMLVLFSPAVWAVDSYRYLHVSPDTPWHIFIFLLLIIMLPFILMAILYWHFAFKKKDENETDS